MQTPLIRPSPVFEPDGRAVDRDTDPDAAAQALIDGQQLVVADHFRTGVEILARLDRRLPEPPATAPHATRQARARAHRAAARRLLVPIRAHRVALHGAEPCGLLAELYPDLADFHLPLVEVQGLVGGWKRHQEGVHLAVLGHALHPYYGTYLPDRTEHLELFATWLRQHAGPRGKAADVGTGCGVLALLLARAGFARVVATDLNPNAVLGLRQDLARLQPPLPVQARVADLLHGVEGPLDLVVFNPPWLPGEPTGLVDAALRAEPELLPRFFDQAVPRLSPDGRVVLVYSDIGRLVRPDLPHPIEAELARGRLRLVQKLRRRVQPEPGPDGRPRRTRERVEIWELAP